MYIAGMRFLFRVGLSTCWPSNLSGTRVFNLKSAFTFTAWKGRAWALSILHPSAHLLRVARERHFFAFCTFWETSGCLPASPLPLAFSCNLRKCSFLFARCQINLFRGLLLCDTWKRHHGGREEKKRDTQTLRTFALKLFRNNSR